jgi:hypothetical protein
MRKDSPMDEPAYDLGSVALRNLGTLMQDSVGVVALIVLLVAGLGLPGLI